MVIRVGIFLMLQNEQPRNFGKTHVKDTHAQLETTLRAVRLSLAAGCT